MSDDTRWSSAETLSRLSRQEFGEDLSTLVAEKLRNDDGKRGLWNCHRDYCGHGLIYQDSQYRLVEVNDSSASEGKVIRAFENTGEFVAWLGRQSDFSLSGIDESEREFHSSEPFNVNNQRITRARLRDYVHDCTASLLPFRNFLFAVDLEFRFLVQEQGFSKVRPRMNGDECVVRYRMPSVARITVMTELQSRPFTTITFDADNDIQAANDASLDAFAKTRDVDWEPPAYISCSHSESDYRQYFRQYADLLRHQFSDLLQPHTIDSPKTVEAPTDPQVCPSESPVGKSRIWGAVIASAALFLLVTELRYFKSADIPAATGSLRGNFGKLVFLGMPCVMLAIGVLQAFVGVKFRHLDPTFSALPTGRRIKLGLGTVGTVVAAILLAAYL